MTVASRRDDRIVHVRCSSSHLQIVDVERVRATFDVDLIETAR